MTIGQYEWRHLFSDWIIKLSISFLHSVASLAGFHTNLATPPQKATKFNDFIGVLGKFWSLKAYRSFQQAAGAAWGLYFIHHSGGCPLPSPHNAIELRMREAAANGRDDSIRSEM